MPRTEFGFSLLTTSEEVPGVLSAFAVGLLSPHSRSYRLLSFRTLSGVTVGFRQTMTLETRVGGGGQPPICDVDWVKSPQFPPKVLEHLSCDQGAQYTV